MLKSCQEDGKGRARRREWANKKGRGFWQEDKELRTGRVKNQEQSLLVQLLLRNFARQEVADGHFLPAFQNIKDSNDRQYRLPREDSQIHYVGLQAQFLGDFHLRAYII